MSEFLLHLGPSDTVSIQQLVEIRYHQGLDMEVTVNTSVLNALDRCGYPPENPHLVTGEVELAALDIRHLET